MYDYAALEERKVIINKKAAERLVEAASSNLDRALDVLERAEALEAMMPVEPEYEEGNTAIVFRKQFSAGGMYYTYCAVGILQRTYTAAERRGEVPVGMHWYVSGSATWQEKKVKWADLMQWLMAGEKWEVWSVSEFSLLGGSDV